MKSTKVIRKKMGRPMIGKKPAAVVPMRLPEELIKAVDTFAEHEGLKSRAEAFRRLVEEALKIRTLASKASAQTEGKHDMAKSTKPHRTKTGAASVRKPPALQAKTGKTSPQKPKPGRY